PQAQKDEPVLQARQSLPLLPTPLSYGHSRYGLGVLSQTVEADGIDPAQITLDNAPPQSDSISAAMSQLLTPMVAALKQGQSVDEAMNIIAQSYPLLDDSTLQTLLSQAIFVADVWGRLHADS
ncbi:DUF935 family protein, partial [Providencia rettgeri]